MLICRSLPHTHTGLMFTDCRLPMKTPLFPLAVIAALLLSLPARADGKAGEAAADSVQKSKEKESI